MSRASNDDDLLFWLRDSTAAKYVSVFNVYLAFQLSSEFAQKQDGIWNVFTI